MKNKKTFDESMQLIKIHEVMSLSTLSRSCVWRLIKRNEFPKPLKITKTAIAWRLSEVKIWMDNPAQWREDATA